MSESDLRMLRSHLHCLERALNAMAWLYHTGQAQHIDEPDLLALERAIQNLVAEITTQEGEGGPGP